MTTLADEIAAEHCRWARRVGMSPAEVMRQARADYGAASATWAMAEAAVACAWERLPSEVRRQPRRIVEHPAADYSNARYAA